MCKPTVPTTGPSAMMTPVKRDKKMPKDSDKVVAERFRTKLCRNFVEKASCPYESRCMFAHGHGQLRTTGMNLRDGLVCEEAIRHFKKQQQRPKPTMVGSAKAVMVQPAQAVEVEFYPVLPREKSLEWFSSEDEFSPVSRSEHGGATSSCSEFEYSEDEQPYPVFSAIEFVTPTSFRFNPYARSILSPSLTC